MAGFANVSVRFDGTINAAGEIAGEATLGTNGELPGGRSITYRIQGRKR